MSGQAQDSPLIENKSSQMVEIMNYNVKDGYDDGTIGTHESRFSIPAQSIYQPYIGGFVKDTPLVGTGATVAIGTDDVGTDPDNILDAQAITALDAENDCLTPAFGTAIVNNTDSALPIYVKIATAALTDGILRSVGLLTYL